MTARQKQARVGSRFAIDRHAKARQLCIRAHATLTLKRGSQLVFKPVAVLPAFNHDLHRARQPGKRAGAGIGNNADA
jgi:hypothetical protein